MNSFEQSGNISLQFLVYIVSVTAVSYLQFLRLVPVTFNLSSGSFFLLSTSSSSSPLSLADAILFLFSQSLYVSISQGGKFSMTITLIASDSEHLSAIQNH